jgi:hypothetical protein
VLFSACACASCLHSLHQRPPVHRTCTNPPPPYRLIARDRFFSNRPCASGAALWVSPTLPRPQPELLWPKLLRQLLRLLLPSSLLLLLPFIPPPRLLLQLQLTQLPQQPWLTSLQSLPGPRRRNLWPSGGTGIRSRIPTGQTKTAARLSSGILLWRDGRALLSTGVCMSVCYSQAENVASDLVALGMKKVCLGPNNVRACHTKARIPCIYLQSCTSISPRGTQSCTQVRLGMFFRIFMHRHSLTRKKRTSLRASHRKKCSRKSHRQHTHSPSGLDTHNFLHVFGPFLQHSPGLSHKLLLCKGRRDFLYVHMNAWIHHSLANPARQRLLLVTHDNTAAIAPRNPYTSLEKKQLKCGQMMTMQKHTVAYISTDCEITKSTWL